MKTILFFFFALTLATNGMAQDTWTITYNGKGKLKAAAEDEQKNVITLSKTDLKKGGNLAIIYTEGKKLKDWERTITLFDEGDNELAKSTGMSFKITAAKLTTMAAKAKELTLYTLSLPTDPNLAARIRVRRLHLCTIIVK